MARKIRVKMLPRRRPVYPSEPGYIASVRAQTKALEDSLTDIFTQFELVSEDICLEALEPTLELAKYYTPKDTGALVESGYLEKAGSRKSPSVEIGFGKGGNPWYAILVHEMVQTPHAAPTQAKFLERAVQEDLDNIWLRLATGYKGFWGT